MKNTKLLISTLVFALLSFLISLSTLIMGMVTDKDGKGSAKRGGYWMLCFYLGKSFYKSVTKGYEIPTIEFISLSIVIILLGFFIFKGR